MISRLALHCAMPMPGEERSAIDALFPWICNLHTAVSGSIQVGNGRHAVTHQVPGSAHLSSPNVHY